MNAIFTRRSVRSFTNQTVEQEKIEQILRAAMQAPSAGNQQSWEFIVIKDKQRLEQLSKYNPYAGCLVGADVGIVIVSNNSQLRFPDYWQQDLGAATQNLLLEATDLGLGTVWLGVEAEGERADFIKEMFQLEDQIHPFAVIAVGYPEKEDANRFVDRYDVSKIKYDC